jgi:hypothetical protein
MRLSASILHLALLQFSFACGEEKKDAMKVPGTLEIRCKLEAISDNIKANTSVRKITSADTSSFITEKIANCCGWFNQLGLGERKEGCV